MKEEEQSELSKALGIKRKGSFVEVHTFGPQFTVKKEEKPLKETRSRTLLKGLMWRVISTMQSFVVMYLLTGNMTETIQMTIILNITGFVLFYVYERLWNKSQWGMK